ncbi:MAG: hypothetical protein ACTSPI_00185 [Candidatus Heimdallarchaeaceae archaeon]
MTLEKRDTDYSPTEHIPLKSPLAIGGYFIHVLRRRFSDTTLPWIWNADETETGIFILSGEIINQDIRNARPALYVNIGALRISDVVVGDRASTEWRREKEYSMSRVDMNITINSESRNKGESHGIAWYTTTAIVAAKDVIRTKYNIANMGPFNLNAPVPNKLDVEFFVSSLTFGISYEVSWNVDAVQTTIKELDILLNAETDESHSEFLTRIYLKNSI